MTIAREAAIAAMKATDWTRRDFLEQLGIETPVPIVPGALPATAREPFAARDLKRLMDLIVIFSIGDFPQSTDCSNYFNPNSPWYNVFYGAYGITSHKPGGTPWGYRADGSTDVDEMLQVPFIDYNFLTAGELGCPPDKMAFSVQSVASSKQGQWDVAECRVTIPSGLHRRSAAVKPNLTYYAVFGFPDPSFLVGGRADYEPVPMHGVMHFRVAAPRTTVVWGAMCPDTPAGNALLQTILAAMGPLYP